MRVVDGSVAEALEALRGAGIDVADAGVIEEPIAPRLWGLLSTGKPIVYRVKTAGRRPPCYVSGLAARSNIYILLGARSHEEAYKRIIDAAEARDAPPITEAGFDEYFKRIGSRLDSIHVPVIYKEDGGPYITAGVFIACHEGVCNASIHRIHVKPQGYGVVRVVPRHLYSMLQRTSRLPVAVAIGLHPAVTLAAATSPPYGFFELWAAARLLGGLRVCRTPLYGLPVPCGASYIIEGVLGGRREPEGPFVDILGSLDQVREEPVLEPQGVYENKVYEAYMHVIVQASEEHMVFMGYPREAMIYSYASRISPGVRRVRLTPGSGGWLHAVVSVEDVDRQVARNIGLAVLAAHPSLKTVIIVDDDIDVDNPYAVEWALATRFQAGRDLTTICGVRGSSLDPSTGPDGTCKTIIIALRGKEPIYERVAPWPQPPRS